MHITRTNKSHSTFSVWLSFLCSCHLYARVSLCKQAFLFTTFSLLPWSCPAYPSSCRTIFPLGSSQSQSIEQPVHIIHTPPLKHKLAKNVLDEEYRISASSQNKPKPKWINQGHKPCISQCPVAQEGKEGKNFLHCWPRTSEGQCSRGSHSLLQHCHRFI